MGYIKWTEKSYKGKCVMNKLSKIFLVIIIVLTIALATMTFLYLKQRDLIYEYMGNYNFSMGMDENETNNIDGNFLFKEEGK